MKAAAEGAEKNYDLERARLPKDRIERVEIYGQPSFIAEVKDGLHQLAKAYPYGYSLVQRYVRGIVQSTTHHDRGTSNGVIYYEANAENKLGLPANCFAAALVRRAVAIRKLLGYQIWRSPRSALGSLNKELEAMRILQCKGDYVHQQVNKILRLEQKLRFESVTTVTKILL